MRLRTCSCVHSNVVDDQKVFVSYGDSNSKAAPGCRAKAGRAADSSSHAVAAWNAVCHNPGGQGHAR